MLINPNGRRILQNRPLINSKTVDLKKLKELKKSTFGRAYVDWLDEFGVSPDGRAEVNFFFLLKNLLKKKR